MQHSYSTMKNLSQRASIFVLGLAVLIIFCTMYMANEHVFHILMMPKDDNLQTYNDSNCILHDSLDRCLCVAEKTVNNNITIHNDSTLRSVKAKCLMTIAPTGRLGNVMGQYATLYSLSQINNRSALLLPEMASQLNDYFDLSIGVMEWVVAKSASWTHHTLEDDMKPGYRSLDGLFVQLGGYPVSWTFYHHQKDEIKREFRFRPHITRDVDAYLRFLGSSRASVTYVGVHIRRGDYVSLMKTVFDGVVADAEYLREAMDYFRSKYEDALFVVCSDDLEWSKTNIPHTSDVVFGWDGKSSSPGHDLALLSRCNHTVMTLGTFGYWAAYLAGGEVVYLTNHSQPDSVWQKAVTVQKNFLPGWKGIAAKNLPVKSYSLVTTATTVTTASSSVTTASSSVTTASNLITTASSTDKAASSTVEASSSRVNTNRISPQNLIG